MPLWQRYIFDKLQVIRDKLSIFKKRIKVKIYRDYEDKHSICKHRH